MFFRYVFLSLLYFFHIQSMEQQKSALIISKTYQAECINHFLKKENTADIKETIQRARVVCTILKTKKLLSKELEKFVLEGHQDNELAKKDTYDFFNFFKACTFICNLEKLYENSIKEMNIL